MRTVQGPNINYEHFSVFYCLHYALVILSLYFCLGWCYSAQPPIQTASPNASPLPPRQCHMHSNTDMYLMSHTSKDTYVDLRTCDQCPNTHRHALKSTNMHTHWWVSWTGPDLTSRRWRLMRPLWVTGWGIEGQRASLIKSLSGAIQTLWTTAAPVTHMHTHT